MSEIDDVTNTDTISGDNPYGIVTTEENKEDDKSWGDKMLHPDRPLTPRHRKLAEYLAMGKTNKEIADLLSYTESRVSILRSNTRILELAEDIRERVFEESVGARLKRMAQPALNVLEACLTDQRNIFKTGEKLDTAKWVVEKLDGKATQKHEVGGSLLVGLMDQLDAMKIVGRGEVMPRLPDTIDLLPENVTKKPKEEINREKMIKAISIPKAPESEKDKLVNEEELLKAWVLDNID